ncbi:MAG: hypothetical protein NVSMB32_01240 [Actinomycetota bacterium]
MSQWLAERAGSWLAARSSRRELLGRATVAGAALATYKLAYVLRPGSAVKIITEGVPSRVCPPDSTCVADGYSAFCCTINHGVNACPSGTIAAGWWKADGSVYCNGPRYYIDCNGMCTGCQGSCPTGFCPECDTALPCDCANGDCHNRQAGCRTFRYGRCNQNVACVGRLACRVVSCTPAWLLDPSCSTVAATDNATADHHEPCMDQLVTAIVAMAATPSGGGYWLVGADGAVFNFGDAQFHGSLAGRQLNGPIVSMAATPSGAGYWLLGSDGGVFSFGDARFYGSTGSLRLNQPVKGMTATPSAGGYWFVATDGGIFAYGDAGFYGSTGSIRLNQPVVGMASTHRGAGYWFVASDGGVFAFGDAGFYGSAAAGALNGSVVGMAASASAKGYWLVTSHGEVLSFGDAPPLGGLVP